MEENQLPAKVGFWNRLKSVLFYEINVELTPYEQKVEDDINGFFNKNVTFDGIKSFLFQEIKF